ncbi:hypothetical protein [Paenibacillus sp. An7]|uniref:hypothetical protein n=1 Tax=Paenibacillus sp. An7 TaxID=2689577 RepID=UPI001358563B|nr:hypothetical protein [Paenibacillus sp. An7]
MFTIRRKDIAFIFIFICLYSLCYCFLTYTGKQEKYHELSNELYTNHHAVLITKKDNSELIKQISKSNYRVFLEYNNSYRLLLENKGNWSPPIVSGSFFTKNDVENKAVVGKEMQKYIEEVKGKKYISFQGENYEVSGIMGASFASSIDYLILLNNPIKNQIDDNTKIIIDSDNKSIVTDITNSLIEKDPTISPIKSAQKGLSRTANIPFIYQLLIFEFYLLMLISIITFIRYWYEKEKKTIYVLFLLGIPKKRINIHLFLKILLNVVVSGALTVIIFLIFGFESTISFNQMILIIILFLTSAWTFLGVFLWSNNSNRGVVTK